MREDEQQEFQQRVERTKMTRTRLNLSIIEKESELAQLKAQYAQCEIDLERYEALLRGDGDSAIRVTSRKYAFGKAWELIRMVLRERGTPAGAEEIFATLKAGGNDMTHHRMVSNSARKKPDVFREVDNKWYLTEWDAARGCNRF